MFAQLFHDQPTPFLAEPFFRKVPATAGQGAEQENGKKTDRADEDSTDQRATARLRNVCNLRKFSYRHADSFVRGSDIFNQAADQVH